MEKLGLRFIWISFRNIRVNFSFLPILLAEEWLSSFKVLSFKIWQYGNIAIRQCGSIAVWHYIIIALWQYGNIKIWHYGKIQYGNMAILQGGSIAT